MRGLGPEWGALIAFFTPGAHFSDSSLAPWSMTVGMAAMARGVAEGGQAVLQTNVQVGQLAVHEALTCLLYVARTASNRRGLLAVRPSMVFQLECILQMWEAFSLPFSPIAVPLQGEEVLCSSDLDLCVGLLFTLASDFEHSHSELQVSLDSLARARAHARLAVSCLSMMFTS